VKPFERRLYARTRDGLDGASVAGETRLSETDAIELARAIAAL
jgi:hypothetical protein